MTIHKIERSFIQFSFRLNKHYPGLIDTYFGPKEIPKEIGKEPKIPLKDLLNKADELLGRVETSDIEENRCVYILEHLQGLKFFLGHTVLNKYSHKELISKIYQFDFEYADDRVLSQRIKELEEKEEPREKLYGTDFFNYFKFVN